MNWITVNADDLRGMASGGVVDGVEGAVVAAAIAEAVAVVRGAVAAGNALDADPATVPGSLRSLTTRLSLYGLAETLRVGLSGDQRVAQAADLLRLAEIREGRQRVEPADDAGGGSQTIVPGNAGHGREELRRI